MVFTYRFTHPLLLFRTGCQTNLMFPGKVSTLIAHHSASQEGVSTSCFMESFSGVEHICHLSSNIPLSHGCRQGYPLSPYHFVLCSEILAPVVRGSDGVKGIGIWGCVKLSQYADHTIAFLNGHVNKKKIGDIEKLVNIRQSRNLTVQKLSSCTSRPNVCQCQVAQTSRHNMSKKLAKYINDPRSM